MSGSFTLSVDLYRCDVDNVQQEDLSAYLDGGSIDLNIDRAVKLAAAFVLREPDRVRPYIDYLAPWVRKTYDDGTEDYRQAGLFAVTVPPGTYSLDDAVATFTGADLTSVLATDVYTDSSDSNAGTTYRGQIQGTIQNGGISRHNIPSTAATLPSAVSWPVGTTRLEKANTLLDQLGWYHLGMDLDGKVSTPGPPQDLASMEPWRTLTDDDMLAPIQVQPGGQGIANVVVVINENATAAPLTATARNDDPSSPTSTVGPADGGVGVGREIARVERVQGPTTQAALDATAARLLAEGRTGYRTARVTLFHDVTALIPHQVVQLTLTGTYAPLSGLWRVMTAKVGLTPGAPLELEIAQVYSDLDGVVI